MELKDRVEKIDSMIISCINILNTSEKDYHLDNAVRLLKMTLDELKMYKNRKNKKE